MATAALASSDGPRRRHGGEAHAAAPSVSSIGSGGSSASRGRPGNHRNPHRHGRLERPVSLPSEDSVDSDRFDEDSAFGDRVGDDRDHGWGGGGAPGGRDPLHADNGRYFERSHGSSSGGSHSSAFGAASAAAGAAEDDDDHFDRSSDSHGSGSGRSGGESWDGSDAEETNHYEEGEEVPSSSLPSPRFSPEEHEAHVAMVGDLLGSIFEIVTDSPREAFGILEPAFAERIVTRYVGPRVAGMFEGRGRAEFESGTVYEGLFHENLMHGPGGRLAWPDGVVYAGDFEKGNISGTGRYEWPDGAVYAGQVRCGLREGYGVFWCGPELATMYEGEWKNGMRDGHGCMTYNVAPDEARTRLAAALGMDRVEYDATAAGAADDRDNATGRRTPGGGGLRASGGSRSMLRSSGLSRDQLGAPGEEAVAGGPADVAYARRSQAASPAPPQTPIAAETGLPFFYEGAWRLDSKHGRGTMYYASGNVYDGDWFNNVKHGEGAMIWGTHNEQYVGEWRLGLPDGYGEYVWFQDHAVDSHYAAHNKYTGRFRAGLREGLGTFYYADGAQYRGQWQDNVKHGYGLYVFADGTVYDGPFEHDHMVEFDRERGAAPGGIRLDVSDLPGVTPADEAEIVNVILRHITYLKLTYRHYSTLGSDQSGGPVVFVLTRFLFWHFLLETGIHDPALSLAAIDRHVARPHADRPSIHFFKYPHSPMEEFLLRDFYEALVRVAVAKYAADTPRISVRLDRLITEHVLGCLDFYFGGRSGRVGGSTGGTSGNLSGASTANTGDVGAGGHVTEFDIEGGSTSSQMALPAIGSVTPLIAPAANDVVSATHIAPGIKIAELSLGSMAAAGIEEGRRSFAIGVERVFPFGYAQIDVFDPTIWPLFEANFTELMAVYDAYAQDGRPGALVGAYLDRTMAVRDVLFLLDDCQLYTDEFTPTEMVNMFNDSHTGLIQDDGSLNLEREVVFLEFLLLISLVAAARLGRIISDRLPESLATVIGVVLSQGRQ